MLSAYVYTCGCGTETTPITFLTFALISGTAPANSISSFVPLKYVHFHQLCIWPRVITIVLILPEMMKALEQPNHIKGGDTYS